MSVYPVILPAVVCDNSTAVVVTETAGAQTLKLIDPATGAVIPTTGVTHKTFYLRGDGATDDLCRALAETLATATGTNTYTCTISRNIDGTALPSSVTIARSGPNNFTVDWANAATTLDERLFGFRNVSTGSVTTATGDVSPTGQWASNEVYEFFEEEDEVQAFVERARSGIVIGGRRGGPYDVRRLALRFVAEQRTLAKAVPTVSSVVDSGRAFANCWARLCTGRPFELHFASISAGTTLAALSSSTRQVCYHGTGTAWHLDADTVEGGFRPERLGPGVGLYAWQLRMLGNVP